MRVLPNSVAAVGAPVEPLHESAPLAWAMAPKLCLGDPADPDVCVWYHQVWQYLRLLGIITSIRTNSDFLVATLARLAADHRRVLICGSADYGMLAHVKHAYGNLPLDITVLDQCPTSLYLNRWYADRFAFNIETVCGSALDYRSDQPFDVICTHNFVGRFEKTERRQLFARWTALLRPGGVAMTTQRVRGDAAGRSSRTVEEARVLSERVVAAAASFDKPLGVDLDELRSVAYEYAVRQGDHSIRHPCEVTDLLEAVGFAIEQCDEGDAAERQYDRPRYPFGEASYRMRLIARRR